MGRAPCCSKLGLNKGAWSAEEDSLLVEYIHTHGEGDWRSLPKKSGLRRCGKSCRLRWLNYLRPSIKRGNITPDEEELIIRMHALLGNRWSMIAGRVPGRTDNEIKNYWNTNLSKKLATRGIDPKTHKFISSSNKAGDRFNQFKELEKQHYCSKKPQHLEPNAAKVCQSTELVIPNVHKGDLKVQYTENKSSSRLLPVESRDTNISISGSSNDRCNYTPADSAEHASLISISDSVEAKYDSGDPHDNGSHVNEKHDELAEYDVFSFFNVSNAENEICCNVDKWVDKEDAHQFMKKESQFALLHGDEERVQVDEEESGNLGSLSMNANDFSHQASNGVTVMSWEAAFWYKFLSPSPNAQ